MNVPHPDIHRLSKIPLAVTAALAALIATSVACFTATYGTNGYDKLEGANSYMILFVCFFNFLRQHSSLKYKTPVSGLFDNNMLMPDQWLKLIEISHQYHPANN